MTTKLFTLFIFLYLNLHSEIYLRDNLVKANRGDFIVTAQGKNYTLLHIFDKGETTLSIEEVTIPQAKLCLPSGSWKGWMQNGAPNYTSWVMLDIDLPSGKIKKIFTFTAEGWRESGGDDFLSTLLNLRLEKIPLNERKRVGPPPQDGPDLRAFWKPKVTFEGKTYSNIPFDAWQTRWPKDNSELSGRLIEIFTPEASTSYPAYFPYWLQISGMIGKAKVRIIDSGTSMVSPRLHP